MRELRHDEHFLDRKGGNRWFLEAQRNPSGWHVEGSIVKVVNKRKVLMLWDESHNGYFGIMTVLHKRFTVVFR